MKPPVTTVDVLIIGSGPAGSTYARTSAITDPTRPSLWWKSDHRFLASAATTP